MWVSVIVPCYNVENYIEECLYSIINQTYQDIEIICVDNNSNDRTLSILNEFRNNYPEKIQILQETKPGAPAARNTGLRIAKGQYIQFLDADDLLEPNKIKHQINLITSETTQPAFIAAACKKIDLSEKVTLVTDIETDPYFSPFINKCGNTCSNLWNREVVLNVGMWNENLKSSQEADLMMRIVLSGNNFIIDKAPLTLVRERSSGQISHRNPESKWLQFIDIRLNYLNKLKGSNAVMYDRYKDIFFDFLMVSVLTLAKYNKEAAIGIYNRSIKDHWQSSGRYGFNQFRVNLIKLFGLRFFINLKQDNKTQTL